MSARDPDYFAEIERDFNRRFDAADYEEEHGATPEEANENEQERRADLRRDDE